MDGAVVVLRGAADYFLAGAGVFLTGEVVPDFSPFLRKGFGST